MKHKIISSKDLDIRCWSPMRYLDSCEDCQRVERCNLPEGNKGRIKILDNRIKEAKGHIKKLREEKELEEDNALKNKL